MAAGPESRPCNNKDNSTDDGDRCVLTVEICAGPFLDRSGYLLHAGIARVRRHDGLNCPCAVRNGQEATKNDDDKLDHASSQGCGWRCCCSFTRQIASHPNSPA
jgi:hypothetical protein